MRGRALILVVIFYISKKGKEPTDVSGVLNGNCYSIFPTFYFWIISWLKFKLKISLDGIALYICYSTIILRSYN